jgi:DNA-binding HxlR family transcriptional regulator
VATGTGGGRLRELSFKRSDCAIACALDVIGDKWTLLIVRDLLLGRSRFGEFLNAGEGIPTNVLARRLRHLEAAGLVERRLAPRPRSRYAYGLTTSGRRLGPVLAALLEWSRSQIPGTRVSPRLKRSRR